KREINEEYCTDVINYEFMGYRDVHREHLGRKTHWISLDFKVLVDPLKAKNGEPHKFDEIKWFNINHLPHPDELHSQIPYFVEKYKPALLGTKYCTMPGGAAFLKEIPSNAWLAVTDAKSNQAKPVFAG
ncbi:MAG TPA: hypothetical protein P5229_05615, partial [Candidatus Gracilibacteria bacterium]|nr:hypothetical protein [Candidatus Gracilibacteria bacterium]